MSGLALPSTRTGSLDRRDAGGFHARRRRRSSPGLWLRWTATAAVGVRFGTIAPVRAGWISRDTVRTIAPAGAPGTVRVALDSFSSHPSLTSAPYAYADPGGLSECVSSPSIVPVTGEVRIELASWGGHRFGSIHVRRCAVGDAEHRLGCVAPAAKPGFAAVWVRGFDPDGWPPRW